MSNYRLDPERFTHRFKRHYEHECHRRHCSLMEQAVLGELFRGTGIFVPSQNYASITSGQMPIDELLLIMLAEGLKVQPSDLIERRPKNGLAELS